MSRTEYVEREAVAQMIEKAQIISDGENCGYCTDDICIYGIPAADVVPVRHGRWDGDICTCCKLPWNYHMCQNADDWGYFDPMPAFCPNCGAKIDLECESE